MKRFVSFHLHFSCLSIMIMFLYVVCTCVSICCFIWQNWMFLNVHVGLYDSFVCEIESFWWGRRGNSININNSEYYIVNLGFCVFGKTTVVTIPFLQIKKEHVAFSKNTFWGNFGFGWWEKSVVTIWKCAFSKILPNKFGFGWWEKSLV